MLGFPVVTQFEQGITFKGGKLPATTRQPGLIWLNPFRCRLVKVNLQTVVAAVPPGPPGGAIPSPAGPTT